MFDCERANVVLVHRFKRFTFRIVPDEHGVDGYERHELGKGITGMVALSGNPTTWSKVNSKNFVKEVDDSNFNPEVHKDHRPAQQIISVPIYT